MNAPPQAPENKAPQAIAVGFAGGSSSGKSTFADALAKALTCPVARISLDNYYLSNDHRTLEERKSINFDSPAAFDWPLFRMHLGMLKNHTPVEDSPLYDFATSTRKPGQVRLHSAPVIIVDGILLFSDAEVRGMLDYRIFVEVSSDLRLIRRLKRDVVRNERGHDLSQSLAMYFGSVRPMHEQHNEHQRNFAHVVLNNDTEKSEENHLGTEIFVEGMVSILKRKIAGAK